MLSATSLTPRLPGREKSTTTSPLSKLYVVARLTCRRRATSAIRYIGSKVLLVPALVAITLRRPSLFATSQPRIEAGRGRKKMANCPRVGCGAHGALRLSRFPSQFQFHSACATPPLAIGPGALPAGAAARAMFALAVAQRRVRLSLPYSSGSFRQAAGCSKPITPGKKVNRTRPVGPLRCLATSRIFVQGTVWPNSTSP